MNEEELNQLLGWVDRSLEGRILKAKSIEKATTKALNKWLLELPTAIDGDVRIIVSDETVSNILASARKEIQKSLAGKEFEELSKSLISDFDGIVANVEQVHLEINGFKIPRGFKEMVISPIRKQAVSEVAGFLSESAIQANMIEPLTRTLLESVQFGYSITDAQNLIAERMDFGKYVGQIARDSFFQFDGTVNNLIAQKYGLDGYFYVGSIVEDSRGQCKRWTEIKRIPKDAIQEEVSWAKRKGEYKGRKKSGMISETSDKNFNIYRGGYNCRHRAIPVRISESERDSYIEKFGLS